jgi:hypothetical protein
MIKTDVKICSCGKPAKSFSAPNWYCGDCKPKNDRDEELAKMSQGEWAIAVMGDLMPGRIKRHRNIQLEDLDRRVAALEEKIGK